jgi:hypothetical protein
MVRTARGEICRVPANGEVPQRGKKPVWYHLVVIHRYRLTASLWTRSQIKMLALDEARRMWNSGCYWAVTLMRSDGSSVWSRSIWDSGDPPCRQKVRGYCNNQSGAPGCRAKMSGRTISSSTVAAAH